MHIHTCGGGAFDYFLVLGTLFFSRMLLHSAAAVEASFCFGQASISMRFVLVGGMLKQATWLMFGGLFSREWRRGLCLDSQPNKGVGLEKESNDQRRLTCVSGFVRWSGFVLAAL